MQFEEKKMFSPKFFLCIALLPIFSEAIYEGYGMQPGMPMNLPNFATEAQRLRPGNYPRNTPPSFTSRSEGFESPPMFDDINQQPIITPNFKSRSEGFEGPPMFDNIRQQPIMPQRPPGLWAPPQVGMQNMPYNNFRQQNMMGLLMSVYSKLLALTQMTIQSMTSPSIEAQSSTDKLQADAEQIVENQLLELQKKQSEQKDSVKAKENSDGNKGTTLEPKDEVEGSLNDQTVTKYQKDGKNIIKLNSITKSP